VHIDQHLVRSLLDYQIPGTAAVALGHRYEGWDCVTYRLGGEWAVRLPRHARAAELERNSHVWLPQLGKDWPFPAPVPLFVGSPSSDYPWPWSIVPWIEGVPAFQQPLSDVGAEQLGGALRAIHTPLPPDAPVNPLRSTTLAERGRKTDSRLAALTRAARGTEWKLDLRKARYLYWTAATDLPPQQSWTHLDLHGDNVLVTNGNLAGIIDWGDAAAGDPATDLGQALCLLPPEQWEILLAAYGGIDGRTFKRARAEALGFAAMLGTIADGPYASAGWQALTVLGVASRDR
jgi:aminoglycoside phosphotransferase (APT) family kinase protein